VARVKIKIVSGDIINVDADVAIAARYSGLGLTGPASAFDKALDNWISRAVDFGMIGSGLGQLFPINLKSSYKASRLKIKVLLVTGMGEPGSFSAGDLRFMMSNITVAVKGFRYNRLCTGLIGTRRNELSIEDAARGFLEGIRDGFEGMVLRYSM
jgi:hypothetical protein